jgi:hypothetical protein
MTLAFLDVMDSQPSSLIAFVMPSMVSISIIVPTANKSPYIGEKKVIIDTIKAFIYFPIISLKLN